MFQLAFLHLLLCADKVWDCFQTFPPLSWHLATSFLEKSQFLEYLPTKEDVGESLCCGEKCKYNPVHHPFDLLKEKATKLAEKVKDEWLPTWREQAPTVDAEMCPGRGACIGNPFSYLSPGWSSSTPDLGAGGKQAVSTTDPGSSSK